MGSSSSKVARGAARKYPTAASPNATATRVAPKARTGAQLSNQAATHEANEDNAPRADGIDPNAVTGDFSQRLQQMGVVQPNPTYSPSSTADLQSPAGIPNQTIAPPQFAPKKANTILSSLEARRRLQQQAELEFEAMGSSSSTGRSLVDMRTLIDALQLLSRGMAQSDAEKKLRLKAGLLNKLGGPRVISHETTA